MSLTLVPPRDGRSTKYSIRGKLRIGDRVVSINETTGLANRELAEAYRIRREAEELQKLLFGARASVTFAKAAVAYLEKVRPGARHRDAINGYQRKDGTVGPNLIDDIGDRLVNEIDQNTIDEIVHKRFRGAKPGTLVRALIGPLTQVLNFAHRRKWCDPPKFERPSFDDRRSRWARPEEVARLLVAAHRLRPLLVFLLLSGARLGEALPLDWADVDLAARWMVFRNTKRNKQGEDHPGEDRGVPIHPQLAVVLANLPTGPGGERTGPVFKSHLGKAYAIANRQGGGQIKTGWAMTVTRAGIADLRVHDLRHTFATRLRHTGADEQLRDEIMGHASTKMGRRYAHVPRPELLAAIDKLPALDMPAPDMAPLGVENAPGVENAWSRFAQK
jgi:integrase